MNPGRHDLPRREDPRRESPCHEFRGLLERALTGRAAPERLTRLAWHEHLFACAGCRALLETEEALESLLASLPEPRLAPEVRARVLARISAERTLDALLEHDGAAAPAGLAAGVLAGLRAGARADLRDGARHGLDRLLALDQARAPAGLAQRALAQLARERAGHLRPLAPRSRELAPRLRELAPRRARQTALRFLGALALAAGLALVAWIAWPDRDRQPDVTPPVVIETDPPAVPAVAPAEPPADELLAALDVLESWDALMAEDVELLLASLPPSYAAVIEDLEDGG